MKRLCVLVVAALVAALLSTVAVSTPASAARNGRPWPTKKITYVDLTQDPAAVAYAAALWNNSGVKITFKKVKSKRKADLIILDKPSRTPQGCGSGRGQLGYEKGRKAKIWIAHGTDADGQKCSVYYQSMVMAHEMGHVLGLGHDLKKCAVMNVNGPGTGLCFGTPGDALGQWYCNPLQVNDLKRAKKFYGGKIKPAPAVCDIVPRMPATGAITALSLDQVNNVSLSLQRLPEPALPGFLAADARQSYYEIHKTLGTCNAVPGNAATVVVRQPWTVAPGGVENRRFGGTAPGPTCFTAFAIDSLGRYALAGTSAAIVNVPAPQSSQSQRAAAAPTSDVMPVPTRAVDAGPID